jgi:hypothetical protein
MRAKRQVRRQVGEKPCAGRGVEHVHAPVEDVVAQMTDLPHDASEQDRLWLERHSPRDVDPDK